MRSKTVFGLLGILVFGSLLLFSFGSQVQGYMDFEQAARTGNDAHVVGKWVSEKNYAYHRHTNTFSFYMADEKGVVRQVRYKNPKPANFEDAEQVVVQGRAEGDVFHAEHILVKCPSKYNEMRAPEADPNAGVSLDG